MKRFILKLTASLFMLMPALFFAGCGDEAVELPEPTPPADLVRIGISNPKIETRTSVGYSLMPEFSTMRLYVYKSGDGAPANPHPDNLVVEETWRVLEGSTATILCNVDDNGTWISDIEDRDISLPASTYDFYLVSPAVKLTDSPPDGSSYNLPGYTVKNGTDITLFTSEPQWFTIGHTAGEIGQGTPGYFSMNPKPFKRLTSRITFTIKKGVKVNELKFDRRGIQLSGLPTNATRANFYIGDQLLRPVDFESHSTRSITNLTYDPTGDNGNGTYYGELQLIPEATPRNVDIRFHLLVNGNNYKAYQYTLNNQMFERGKSYNFDVTVNVGGIFVTGWNTNEWETVIEN